MMMMMIDSLSSGGLTARRRSCTPGLAHHHHRHEDEDDDHHDIVIVAISITKASPHMLACACRIVFVEGNYILLDEEPWSQLQSEELLSDRVFVDTNIDECMNRVFR